MNITVCFHTDSPIVEIFHPAEIRHYLAAGISAAEEFLRSPERTTCRLEWLPALEKLQWLAEQSSTSARLNTEEARSIFELTALASLAQARAGGCPHALFRSVLCFAEIVPCRLTPMILPPQEDVWPRGASEPMASQVYDHLYHALDRAPVLVPLLQSYLLYRELSPVQANPAVVALRYQLETATALLDRIITELNKARLPSQ